MFIRRAQFLIPLLLIAACGGATETGLFGDPDPGSTDSGSNIDATGDDSTGDDSDGAASDSGGAVDSGVPSDSGSEIGSPCDPNDSTSCPSGAYCNASGCGASGVCTAKPTTVGADLSPVCGCDNVTYWNGSVAAERGISTKASGTCGSPISCSGQNKCVKGTYCNKGGNNVSSCAMGGKGTCWGIPDSCPKELFAYECSSQKCDKSICELIKNERAFYGGCKAN